MEQGRVAACHAFDIKYKTEVARQFPYGLYTIPEVSMIGDTEEELKKKGIDYEVGRALYENNARGQICGDLEGIVKLVFEPATTRSSSARTSSASARPSSSTSAQTVMT